MIFVTGGHGFMGTELCRALTRQRYSVVAPTSRECDLTNFESLKSFESHSFTEIFHLAAWTQAGDFCLTHPGEQWIINQQINTNVLKWWSSFQPQAKLTFIGTSCAYAPGSALIESNYMLGEPVESLYTYAMTKRMLFQGARALSAQFGLKWFSPVPSTLYGPGYHTDGRQMHFIFDLIRKIIRAKEFGETVTLWGDGFQKREIVYTADYIDILLRARRDLNCELLNIGSGQEFTIREFAGEICSLVGYPVERIQYDTSRYVGARSKCLDISKLRSLYPDFRETPMRTGLERTIAWFYETGAYRQDS